MLIILFRSVGFLLLLRTIFYPGDLLCLNHSIQGFIRLSICCGFTGPYSGTGGGLLEPLYSLIIADQQQQLRN